MPSKNCDLPGATHAEHTIYLSGVKIVIVDVTEKKIVTSGWIVINAPAEINTATTLTQKHFYRKEGQDYKMQLSSQEKWVKAQARISRCKSLHVGATFF